MAGRERYRRPGSAKPAAIEIRLIPLAGSATDAEYRDALRDTVETGEVPPGWEVRSAAWGHFQGGTFRRWQTGDVVDLAGFGAVAASGKADIGVERRTSRARAYQDVPVTEQVTETIPVSRGTRTHRRGTRVSDGYAARYPHLVRYIRVTYAHRVMRRRLVTVTVEEAVVRLKYNVKHL